MKSFLFLGIAVIFETFGTSLLKLSAQFTRPWPTACMVLSYAVTFYFLGLSLKTIPVGVAYGIWGGLGIVLVTAVGAVFFKQTPDLPAVVGLLLIIGGVVTINLFSEMGVH